MLPIPHDLARLCESLLRQKGIAQEQRPCIQKWLRYYLGFCRMYGLVPTDRGSLPAFDEKLSARNQSEARRQQASRAIAVYYEALASDRALGPPATTRAAAGDATSPVSARPLMDAPCQNPAPTGAARSEGPVPGPAPGRSHPTRVETAALAPRPPTSPNRPPPPATPSRPEGRSPGVVLGTMEAARQLGGPEAPRASGESTLTGASWVWVYDSLDSAIKVRHYSPKTLDF